MSQISRRDFVQSMGLSMGCALSFGAPSADAKQPDDMQQLMGSGSTPNVLLIYSDQHRYDCLGVAGHPDIKTPNIDAIATEGVW